MIPFAKDRFKGINEDSFHIKPSLYRNEWGYYCEQYVTVFDYLLGIAKQKHYQINCQFMSFMFVFRQTVELLFKNWLSNTGNNIPMTHSLSKLAEDLGGQFISLVNDVPNLLPNSDGSQFRYYATTDGTPFYTNSEILRVAEDCNTFINFVNSFSLSIHINNTINPQDKVLNHELSFHMSECRGLGHIKSHYDMTIDCLINGVVNNEINVNTIYLPLMFLIRHGMELALKSNLLDLGNALSDNSRYALANQHSVFQLFKLLFSYVGNAIDAIPKEDILKRESEKYKMKVTELKELIHKFDAKSEAFRYPSEKNLRFKRDEILTALKLYYEVDSFLTGAVIVLFEAGYLDIGDDVIYKYYN